MSGPLVGSKRPNKSKDFPVSFISSQEENSFLIQCAFKIWTDLYKADGISRVPGPHYSCPSPLVSASISLSLSPMKSIKSIALKSKLKVFLNSNFQVGFFFQSGVCGPIWVGCWLTEFCWWVAQNEGLRPALSGLPWSSLIWSGLKSGMSPQSPTCWELQIMGPPPVLFWLCNLLSPL